jgi:hypothetical protein
VQQGGAASKPPTVQTTGQHARIGTIDGSASPRD